MALKNVSELRIVLLGNNSSEISRVGNFILGRDVFETEAPPRSVEQHSERARGNVEGRYITLINTPHLFDSQFKVTQMPKSVRECMSLCAPGPHVIMLVIQPDDFTETDRHRLKYILSFLSADVQKYTFTLTTQMLQSGSSEDQVQENIIQKIINECNKRHFEFSYKCSRSALVKMMEKIVKENAGSYIKREEYETPAAREVLLHKQTTAHKESEGTAEEKKTSSQKNPRKSQEKPAARIKGLLQKFSHGGKSSDASQRLNLVVCGSDEAVKSSISDLILGQRQHSPESSSLCVRREGEVCGRPVTLVEMPALYNTHLSEEEVMQETLRCVSLCDPGVHAFLLIIPEGVLTDEDKGEMEKIQRIFGSRFNSYTIFLINTESQKEAMELDKVTKYIIETYKVQAFVLDVSQNSVLLQKVIQMLKENNESCYTTSMYLQAQVETQLKYKYKIDKLQRTIKNLREKNKNQTQESFSDTGALKIVLLGKTGAGKSVTGNTILGKDVFRHLLSSQSVTSVCQKESAEVGQRQISVIDTPGLFDVHIPNEEIRKEIAKCITMAAPGPHAFLLVLSLGRYTQEEKEAMKMIQEWFGDESRRYTIVLFTGGDNLQERSIEDFIKDSERSLQNIIYQCGNRYHVFNNKNPEDRSQVTALLEKINSMVTVNGGSCYTNEMLQQTEKALQEEQERILKEKEEEIEREKEELKAKHEAEIEKMKRSIEEERKEQERERKIRENEFRTKEEQVKKEFIEREKLEREHYNKRIEKDEKRMKEWMAQINKEREENRKKWEKQREEDQRRRDQEEKERKKKEEEWKKKQREEKEKFDKEKEEMMQKERDHQKKLQQEYEQKAEEEENRRRELEEKIKHAEESKRKELLELQFTQQIQWERRKLEEEQRREEQEKKWKIKMESKEQEWQFQQNKKEVQHEHERAIEKARRALEEENRKQKDDEEKKRIENEAKEKIKEMQQQLKVEREQEEKRRKEKDEQHRKELEEQQKTFRKEKEKAEERQKEEEQRKLAFIEDRHAKQMENLQRETELKARKQAEEKFCAELDQKVKEARNKGFEAGCAKVESERTKPGRAVDRAVNWIKHK